MMTAKDWRFACLNLAAANSNQNNVLSGQRFGTFEEVIARAQAYLEFVQRGRRKPEGVGDAEKE